MRARLRTIAAATAGIIAWPLVATAGNLILRSVMNGFREAEPAMNFSSAMLVGRLAVGLVAAIACGIVARVVAAGSGPAPWIAGIVLLAAFLPLRIGLWSRFPVVYHLFFLASLVAMPPLAARQIVRPERAYRGRGVVRGGQDRYSCHRDSQRLGRDPTRPPGATRRRDPHIPASTRNVVG